LAHAQGLHHVNEQGGPFAFDSDNLMISPTPPKPGNLLRKHQWDQLE
jgi:hypothetical protein